MKRRGPQEDWEEVTRKKILRRTGVRKTRPHHQPENSTTSMMWLNNKNMPSACTRYIIREWCVVVRLGFTRESCLALACGALKAQKNPLSYSGTRYQVLGTIPGTKHRTTTICLSKEAKFKFHKFWFNHTRIRDSEPRF